MRPLVTIFLAIVTCAALAQIPAGISYQGVARSADGQPVENSQLSIEISILSGGPSGRAEYVEDHFIVTNKFGLFTLVIGQGDPVSGNFEDINWSLGSKWVQVAMDTEGGSNYAVIGSQELLSVPYAIYAREAGSGQTLTKNGITREVKLSDMNGSGGGGFIDAVNDPDSVSTNEAQVLVKDPDSNIVTLSDVSGVGGGSFRDAVNDPDSVSTNEAQVLTRDPETNMITLSDVSGVGGGSFVDADADRTNEIQDLVLRNDTIRITGHLAPSPVDLSPYRQELNISAQNTLRSLNISGGNTVEFSVADPDSDSTNELLTGGSYQSGNILRLADRGGDTYIDISTLTGDLDAGTYRIKNAADPTETRDLTTKGYVDSVDNSLLTNITSTYAFKANFSYENTSGGTESNVALPITNTEFDDFSVISGNEFLASENGIYVIMVKGKYSTSTTAANLNFLHNSNKITIPIYQPFGSAQFGYSETIMLKLDAGESISIVADNIPDGASFDGDFFGYKL